MDLQKYQEILYELLESFVFFCQENHLKYYLAGGTLLGAVRHTGFIPWDDDIDVLMPEEDFQYFLSHGPRYFSTPLKIQSHINDPQYPFLFAKLCNTSIQLDTGYKNIPLGAYIDIFPLVQTNGATWINRCAFNILKVLSYILQVKSNWCSYIPYKQKSARIGYALLSIWSIRSLKKLRQFLAFRLIKSSKGELYCSVAGMYDVEREFVPMNWFEKDTRLLFKQGEFNVPAEWDLYLRHFFGDYMLLPPEDERKKHIIKIFYL